MTDPTPDPRTWVDPSVYEAAQQAVAVHAEVPAWLITVAVNAAIDALGIAPAGDPGLLAIFRDEIKDHPLYFISRLGQIPRSPQAGAENVGPAGA